MKNHPQTPDNQNQITTEPTKKKTGINKLVSFVAAAIIVVTSTGCSKEDPIEPVDTQNPIVALSNVQVVDGDGDGILNDVTGNYTATDNVGVVAKSVKVGNINGSVSGNTFIVHNIPTGSGTLSFTAIDNNNNSTTKTEAVNIAQPNQAPVITVTLNDFDEHTPIGTVVGSITASDPDGDTLTYSLVEGGDKFELDGTEIKTKVLFDYEDAQNTHSVKVRASDSNLQTDATDSANETDSDEAPETVDLADITYTRSLDNMVVTEDVSYTSTGNANGYAVEVTIDKADNDPNNTNNVTYLLHSRF